MKANMVHQRLRPARCKILATGMWQTHSLRAQTNPACSGPGDQTALQIAHAIRDPLSLFSKGVWVVRSNWRLGRSCRAGRRRVSFACPDYVVGYPARTAVPLNLAVSLGALAFALVVRSGAVSVGALVPDLNEIVGLAVGGVVSAFYGAQLKRISRQDNRRAASGAWRPDPFRGRLSISIRASSPCWRGLSLWRGDRARARYRASQQHIGRRRRRTPYPDYDVHFRSGY